MSRRIKFENRETFDGVTEWDVTLDGDCIGQLSRDTPRHSPGTRRGLVSDGSRPHFYMVSINGVEDSDIPDGSDLHAVRRIIAGKLDL